MPPSPVYRRPRVATLLAACAVLCGAAATASVTPARADSIAAKKAEAAQVESQIMSLNMQLDAAQQQWDHATEQLDQARAATNRNRRLLKTAKANLHAARKELATMLVSGYKQQGPGVDAYLLSSSSIANLVDRLEFIDRSNQTQAGILEQIRTSEQAIQRHQRALVAAQRQAAEMVAKRAQQKQEAANILAQRQALLQSVKGEIATLIKQKQEAEARAARERAARAAAAAAAAAAAQKAAQQQQQTPPTTTTTSGGGGGGSSSGGGTPVRIPPAGSLGEKAVQIAEQELGVPYVWGGASPSGFDCSGLTMWVYAQLGVHLDHYTGAQWNEGVHVSRSELAPGDLVFFEQDIGHVGIYIGGNEFIEAPHTGGVVQISSLTGWYAAEYQGAVRVTG